MRNTFFKIAISLHLVFGFTLSAYAKEWSVPDHGFTIAIETPQGIPQRSGSMAKITGKINLIGARLKGQGSGKGNATDDFHWKPNTHQKEKDATDLLDLMKKDGVEIKAYFPDFTKEITNNVVVRAQGNHLAFDFDTPHLNRNDPNAFILQVVHHSPAFGSLQKIQAKIERRVFELNRRAAKLAGKGANVSDAGTLHAMAKQLEALSSKLARKLGARVETLAEARFPLQVDNIVSGPSYSNTVMNKFRLLVEFNIGSAIEGEKVTAVGSITNLRKPEDLELKDEDRDVSDLWLARFFWQGNQVQEIGPEAFANGSTISFSHATGKLLPGNLNLFATSIYAWNEAESSAGKRFGNIGLVEPVAPDTTVPKWVAGWTPDTDHPYVQHMQPVFADITDEFGLIDLQSFRATLRGTRIDGSIVDENVTPGLQFTSPDQGQSYSVRGDLNAIDEGVYTFRIDSADLAGNRGIPNPLETSFRVDRTSPRVILGVSDHYLTNNRTWTIPITVEDHSPTVTSVLHNGFEIVRTSDVAFGVPVSLKEGMNFFEVRSVDAAGNAMPPVRLNDVVLDTIPPVLSEIRPQSGSILNALAVPISGNSNEPLQFLRVNGQNLQFSPDRKSYSGVFQAVGEGSLALRFEASDLAGNLTIADVAVQISLKVLNQSLIAVASDPDGLHLIIRGAVGATRPGIPVKASASFLNYASTVSASDGSFSIKLKVFTKATVSATDASLNRTETAEVIWGSQSDILLSGTVMDATDTASGGIPRVLVGATVSIAGTSLSTTTGPTGVFEFRRSTSGISAITGDQSLVIDGSTALQQPAPAPQRKFSFTRISITLGISQSTVLQRPIYLVGIPTDQNIPKISVAAGGTVKALNDSSISLTIPAAATQFPDSSSEGVITATVIPANYSTIRAPHFSQPKKVIALEPSGTTFSKPVQLTVPNVDNLPNDTDVVILSMNSRKGIWEIDGVGRVSGDKIVTKPNMGIRHFSLVYASPLGPKVSQIGAQDRPGADAFNGALATSISLPSYKSLGKDISPSLMYKSSWARPTALVTSLFNLPREDVTFADGDGGGLGTLYREEVSVSSRRIVKPKYVTSQFWTTDIPGDKVWYQGADLPEKAVTSYAIELKKKPSGEYLSTNVYPYQVKFEVQYDQTVVQTTTKKVWEWWGDPEVTQDSWTETRELEKAFPQDLVGPLYVQNEVNSAFGRGWRPSGIQRIANPQDDRVFIEEGDGSISSYAVDNTINTIFNATSTGIDLNLGSDLSSWPMVPASYSDGRTGIIDFSGMSPNIHSGNSLGTYSGTLYGGHRMERTCFLCDGYNGSYRWTNFTISPKTVQLLLAPNGTIYGTDGNRQIVFQQLPGQSDSTLAGHYTIPPYKYVGPQIPAGQDDGIEAWFGAICSSTPGTSCGQYFYQGDTECGNNPGCIGPRSSGSWPFAGFTEDGSLFASDQICGWEFNDEEGENVWRCNSTEPYRLLNKPAGMTAGPRPNTLVVADSGNHRVRMVDLNAGTITTVAGVGDPNEVRITSDGDGGLATAAKLFHPVGVAYDALGNLYISEGDGNGRIRVVDATTGIISTLVGGAPTNPDGTPGATPGGDNRPAAKVLLSYPFGMVVDNQNHYLYIAETGANMVRRVELHTPNPRIMNVAGNNYTAGFGGDGGAALGASLNRPTLVGLDEENNLLILDSGNQRIRRVTFQNTTMGPVAFASLLEDHSRLVREDNGTWTRKYRNDTTVRFDAQGRQVSSTDRVGRTTSYDYEGEFLRFVTDAGGRTLTYNYLGDRLSSIVDPAGRPTEFRYTAYGELEKVIFPDGTAKEFKYDNQGLLLSEKDQSGNETKYGYNDWNRLETVTRADATVTTVNDSGSMSAGNNYSSESNAGKLRAYGNGSDDVQDSITTPSGLKTIVIKDEKGFVAGVEDPTGKSTEVSRDDKGRIEKIKREDGTTIEFKYDSVGDLVWQRDSAIGVETSQTFDGYGNLKTKTNGRGLTSSNEYYPNGSIKSKTDPMGHKVVFEYGGPHSLMTVVTNSIGKKTKFAYDAHGNLSDIWDPMDHHTEFKRDPAGNISETIDARGKTTKFKYDKFNRLVEVESPKLEKTFYRYYATGQLKEVEDHLGNIASYQYDNMGRVLRKTDASGKTWTYSYYPDGTLQYETDPNNKTKEYHYDRLGRLEAKILPEKTTNFTYNDSGSISVVEDGRTEVSYSYDAIGRVKTIGSRGMNALSDLPSATLQVFYNNSNARRQLDYSVEGSESGTFTYDYDDSDRLTSIVNPKRQEFTFVYDDVNGGAKLLRAGIETEIAINNAGGVTSIRHLKSGNPNPIAAFTYELDEIGNRTKVDDGTFSRSLGYNENAQLTSASNPEASSNEWKNETFTYDAIYNRTADQNPDHSYQYDGKKQRLVSDWRYFYFYDENGNLISKQAKGLKEVTNFTYSTDNQLLGFKVYIAGEVDLEKLWTPTSVPFKEVNYVYDAIGRRIQKRVHDFNHPDDPLKTFTRRYVYDGEDILLEYDGENQLLARYTHSGMGADDILAADITEEGGEAALAQQGPGSHSYFYLKDGNGTVTDIVDSSGKRVQHYVYSAFGEILRVQNGVGQDVTAAPVVATSFTFTGREYDRESGYYYYRARYYDPILGRFLQKDPHPGSLSVPITVVNGYAYAGNNPFNFADPSGKSFLGDLFLGLIISAAAFFSAGAALALLFPAGMTAGIGSAAIGAVVGAVAGAAGGAVAGALAYGISGQSMAKGFATGLISGAVSGAVAGFMMGWSGKNPIADLFEGPKESISPTGSNELASSVDEFGGKGGDGVGDVDGTAAFDPKPSERINLMQEYDDLCISWAESLCKQFETRQAWEGLRRFDQFKFINCLRAWAPSCAM